MDVVLSCSVFLTGKYSGMDLVAIGKGADIKAAIYSSIDPKGCMGRENTLEFVEVREKSGLDN
jgi:hypothetical protein